MKSFFQFLGEASQASMQAKKLNLKSDGHGGWLDSRGEFVAKTEDGKLKFFNQGQKPGEKDPDQVRTKNNQQPVATQNQPKKQEPEATKKAEPKPEEGGEGGEDTLTVTFGRFNPPTVGHKKLLTAAKKAAQGGELKVYPSRTQDPKKNPLDPDMKISYMKKMFPDYEENIVNDDEMKSIFNVLTTASEEG